MKKLYVSLLAGVFTLMFITFVDGRQCMANEAEKPPAMAMPTMEMPAMMPSPGMPHAKMPETVSAKVVESIITKEYTYVLVDTGKKKIWTATRDFNGNPGDTVLVPKGIPMENFHSKALDRDFKMIYFVDKIGTMGGGMDAGMKQKMPEGHPDIAGKARAMKIPASMGSVSGKALVKPGSVVKADGGKTVSEIIADSKNLAGKKVLLRAKVIKFSPSIMGKNWLHVQDGTGGEGKNELIVTTAATVKVGDLVLINGIVSVDKDFGFGLKYPIIVENATVTVEK